MFVWKTNNTKFERGKIQTKTKCDKQAIAYISLRMLTYVNVALRCFSMREKSASKNSSSKIIALILSFYCRNVFQIVSQP